MEMSMQEIHQSLKSVIDYQTHHRLRETQGRRRAEDLNNRVLWWSLMETVLMLFVSIAQVLTVKNLFSEKKSPTYNRL